MKKMIILFGVLIVVGWGFWRGNWRAESVSVTEELQNQGSAPAGAGGSGGMTVRITKDQVYTGNLLLVNQDYPVPKAIAGMKNVRLSSTKELSGRFVLADETVQLTDFIASQLETMFAAAEKDGVSHFRINSGYRNEKEQNRLFKQMGDEYALPAGYSEHNLGLSVDIGSTLMEMSKAPEGEWLQNNAWRYGFVLRYPKNKTEITGIRYEPWHFRYVGLPHSAIMQQKNLVLEEYLDELKEKQSVTVRVGSQRYGLFYYPVDQDKTVQVPAKGQYEVWGDNRQGVIITVTL